MLPDLSPLFVRTRVHIRGGQDDDGTDPSRALPAAVLRFALVLQADGARVSRLSFRVGELPADTAEQRRQQRGQPLRQQSFCVAAWAAAPDSDLDSEAEDGGGADGGGADGGGAPQGEPTALRVAIEGCCLAGGSGVSCIVVRGCGTFARVLSNNLSGGSIGLAVTPGASALVRANRIVGAEDTGLLLQSGARSVVERNRVERCEVGVLLGGATTSAALLATNTIERNNIGVMAVGECGATLQRCVVRGNFAGVRMRDRAAPSLDACVLQDNKGDGVHLMQDAHPVLHGCRIVGNGGVGLMASGDTRAVVKRCVFSHNGGCGAIVTLGDACASIEDSEIVANDGAGVVSGEDSLPRLHGNDVHHNGLSGVMCTSSSAAQILGNSIHHNFRAGVVASGTSSPVVRGNDVHSNDGVGLLCTRASTPKLEENTVHANVLRGIEIGENAKPVLAGNTMRGNGDAIEGEGGDCARVSLQLSPASMKRQRDEDEAEDEELAALDGQ